jgi:hypothetical protein
MNWAWVFGIIGILCLVGVFVIAVLDVAKTSGADQEDEHEQGGI